MMGPGAVARHPWQQLAVAFLMMVMLNLWSSIHLVDAQRFCSAFGNRSPSPQPGLQNCTWYRESSCCLNEEITSLFNTVNPPDNADGRCLNFLNYLMCYVCDPGQSNFYQQERLTVCEAFCDDALDACSNAVLKGVRLGTHFRRNGSGFCAHLRFEVGTNEETCFTLAPSRRTLSSSTAPKPGRTLVLALLVLALVTCRARCLPTLLVAVLLTVLCATPQPSVALVSNANMQRMAAALEGALVNIAGDGIKRDRVQDTFEMASSSRNELNASAILVTIERQLEDLVGDLNSAANDLVRAVLAARTTYMSSSQTAQPLANLSLATYIDSDNISALSTLNMTFNSTYRRFISKEQSVVKIADEVTRTGARLLETVQWTAGIDSSLARLQERRNVRWTYFGSETGVYRSYPAAEWPSTFAGLKLDYDPRSRPWYLAATSGPKAVGIFLDCSTSMEDSGRWSMAVAAVRQIVNSLTRDDQVNIMCARGSYYNSGGTYRTYRRAVLGCSANSFMRATVSNRAQLLERLSEQSPAGSAAQHEVALLELVAMFPNTPPSCMNVLVFITDGLDTDDDHYRDRCRSNSGNSGNNGQSSYHGCNIIRLSNQAMWDIASAEHRFRSVRVVGIETGNAGSQLPGMMACDNDGVFIQLQSTQNIRFQLSPYFSYLSRLGNPSVDSIRPTSPYIDVTGLGRIITLARPIYEPGSASVLLGVVGVDAVLDDLENTLLDDQFGLSYAFLIDTEGRAIVHPRLTPSAELADDPIYPRVTELEQDPTGAPSGFNDVLVRMMRQERGVSALITGPRPQQRGSVNDGVVFRQGIRFTYHYSSVSATQYSFAFVLTVEDTDQDMLLEIPFRQSQPVNYYHELQRYPASEHAALGFTLGTNFGYGSSNNPLFIAQRQSTFKLASRAFCDPTRYLLSDFPSFDSVASFFNSNQSYVPCSAGGRYLEDIRPTVWATQAIQDVWINNRSLATQDEVAWTYFGSANGVWRSLPGSQSTRSYDPTRRPWYHRALANPPSLYATSAVYLDAGGVGKVVTLAQTIFHGRNTSAMTAMCSVVGSYDGGCSCASHAQCRSQYCDRGFCTNPAIAGVAAIDLRYGRFASLVESTLNSVPGIAVDQRCTAGSTRCILVNDAAEIVYDESIIGRNISDRDPRNFANVPLAFLHGGVMLSLLDEGVFTRFSFINRQGTCQRAPYTPSASDRDIILSADQQDNYFENRGPIPRFQNNFGCELDQILYQRNTSTSLSDFSRSFQGPCEDGSYRVYPVTNTNLLLVVIDRTQVKSDLLFNFNCHIFNNIARSGGFQSEETACGGGSDGTEVMTTCSPFSGFIPQCFFNTASTASQSLAVLFTGLLSALFILPT